MKYLAMQQNKNFFVVKKWVKRTSKYYLLTPDMETWYADSQWCNVAQCFRGVPVRS